jgi:hypothetical protein
MGIFLLFLLLASIYGSESCNNSFEGKVVRASGTFSYPEWSATEPLGLMTLDKDACEYYVLILDARKNFSFEWDVNISNSWAENYGCGRYNCVAKTNKDGAVRLIFKPESLQLRSDYNFVLPPLDQQPNKYY